LHGQQGLAIGAAGQHTGWAGQQGLAIGAAGQQGLNTGAGQHLGWQPQGQAAKLGNAPSDNTKNAPKAINCFFITRFSFSIINYVLEEILGFRFKNFIILSA
jgi:hypothetical protein